MILAKLIESNNFINSIKNKVELDRRMESIKELRKICQPRPVEQRSWSAKFNRSYSIYITYLFLKLRIHQNLVTFLAFISYIIAGLLLISQNWILVLLSPLFLQLYHAFDHADGEIARYRRKASLTGLFIDRIGGILAEPFFWVGLSYKLISFNIKSPNINIILLVCLICTSLPLLSKLILEAYYATIIDGQQKSANTLGIDNEFNNKNEVKENITSTESLAVESKENLVKAVVWFLVTGSGKPLILLIALIFDYLREVTFGLSSFLSAINIHVIGIGFILILYSLLHLLFVFVFIYSTIKNKTLDDTPSD